LNSTSSKLSREENRSAVEGERRKKNKGGKSFTDGAVDDRDEDENEDEEGTQARSLSDSSNGESGSDTGEHALD
jgi:hypothetical protein